MCHGNILVGIFFFSGCTVIGNLYERLHHCFCVLIPTGSAWTPRPRGWWGYCATISHSSAQSTRRAAWQTTASRRHCRSHWRSESAPFQLPVELDLLFSNMHPDPQAGGRQVKRVQESFGTTGHHPVGLLGDQLTYCGTRSTVNKKLLKASRTSYSPNSNLYTSINQATLLCTVRNYNHRRLQYYNSSW